MREPTEYTGTSPFHEGELAVQRRAGVEQSVAGFAHAAIRPFMPEQHRSFFAALPFIIVSARDQQGRAWATLLAGNTAKADFIHSPDDRSLTIEAAPVKGDALEHALLPGASIGLLGIALESRRRNRLNGTLGEKLDGALHIQVDQSFGNCPQYISQRQWAPAEPAVIDPVPDHLQQLDEQLCDWISKADTCFIASGFKQSSTRIARQGMDVSHRGGPEGFVRVISPTQLSIPDYAGNDFFNTLGNLTVDPGIGLLFLDFETGSMLQISGIASINWSDESLQGSQSEVAHQRSILIDISHIIRHHSILPIRWSTPAGSVRELLLSRRTIESESVTSFEFTARDNGALPAFEAGQHLPIKIPLSRGQSLERSYSLSGSPQADTYRISVKREVGGQVSNFLHDYLHEGQSVLAQAPSGDFVLQDSDRPIVLLAAGIGITPLLSMLYRLSGDSRPVSLLYSNRNARQRPFEQELKALALQGANISTLFSQPGENDVLGQHFDHVGRIDIATIKEQAPELDADFYLCGPTGFLGDLQGQLLDAGVDINRIHVEQF